MKLPAFPVYANLSRTITWPLMLIFAGAAAAGEELSPAVPNRAPLLESAWVALPLGSVRPEGWLREMLELQRDGLTGHAEELQQELGPDNGWKGGPGESGERAPYYLRGLVSLAWQLDDPGLKSKAREWIDAILASQRPDGFYGPDNDDWWPRMLVNHMLRDFHEATGDPRVIPFLTSYYKYQSSNLRTRPLGAWGRARAGDEIESVFWLYNRTGDRFLPGLADLLAEQAYPWKEIYSTNRFMDFGHDPMPKHAVNVAQAAKMPAIYFQRSGDPADRDAFGRGHGHLERDHGLAVGINSGSEMLSGRSTTQGVELCSVVERMLSDAAALRVLGEAPVGDHLESMAFNLLPGSLSEDLHQHVYYCIPNQAVAREKPRGFNQDKPNGTVPSHRSGFPCCCFNLHMGWPKFVQNSWAASADGGVVQLAIAPVNIATRVRGGEEVKIAVKTDYPFGESVEYEITTGTPVKFPLFLRIPAWCEGSKIQINGGSAVSPKAGTFARLERVWRSGDKIRVALPMQVHTERGVHGSISVKRGPLAFVLAIKEQRETRAAGPLPGFEAYGIEPASPWNYALEVDAADPASSFTVERAPMNDRPFRRETTPVRLKARGKLLPAWELNRDGSAALEPPRSPVRSEAPWTALDLVPFGAGMLRITSFPVLGDAPAPSDTYRDTFATGHHDGWLTYGGGWRTADGKLQNPIDVYMDQGSGGAHAVATDTLFSDFVYDAVVSVGKRGDAGVIFRASRPSIGANAFDGYYAGISAEGNTIMLGKAGGDWHPLQIVGAPVEANREYRLRVVAKAATIQVFLDDMDDPVLTAEDGSYASGMIGVRRYCTAGDDYEATYSRLNVRSLAADRE